MAIETDKVVIHHDKFANKKIRLSPEIEIQFNRQSNVELDKATADVLCRLPGYRVATEADLKAPDPVAAAPTPEAYRGIVNERDMALKSASESETARQKLADQVNTLMANNESLMQENAHLKTAAGASAKTLENSLTGSNAEGASSQSPS